MGLMVTKIVDRVISHRAGGVELGSLGIKKAAVWMRRGSVKSILQWLAINMPFSDVIRSIAERHEHLGQQHGPLGSVPMPTWNSAGNRVTSDLLSVVARQK